MLPCGNSNPALCAIVMAGLPLAAAGPCRAAVIDVYEGESIQAAVDAAVSLDIIFVHAGTYYESIDLRGKTVWLHAVDGAAVTTIDGSGTGQPVVQCVGGEFTAVSDFTITGGDALWGGGMYLQGGVDHWVSGCVFTGNATLNRGGGMYISGGTLDIENCTFSDNSAASHGGGMSIENDASPTISDCTFIGNTADQFGGGINIDGASPTVMRCTFTSNTAVLGGGMRNKNAGPTLTDCFFTLNTATSDGGGMHNDDSGPTITQCIFLNNTASDEGGGVCVWGSSLVNATNCTFTGNTAGGLGGGGLFSSGGDTFLTNCILWGDGPDEIFIMQGSPTMTVSYCDVQGGWAGMGNIGLDPMFVLDLDGIPRPDRYSPCIDAGDNAAVPLDITTDFDGLPRFVDDATVVDTGAGTPPIVDLGACEWQDDSYAMTLAVPGGFPTIQAAIDYSRAGDEIVVEPGTYVGWISLQGKAITLRSTDPTDPAVVAATVLDGQGVHHVVRCSDGEGPDTVLSGFTITGGYADGPDYPGYYGGGMFNEGSSPTVTYCVFTGNRAMGEGGGMANISSHPHVEQCRFEWNWTKYKLDFDDIFIYPLNGGGMYNRDSSPSVVDCQFVNNHTDTHDGEGFDGGSGGGMYNTGSSSPVLTGCLFEGNWCGSGSNANIANNTPGGDGGHGGAIFNGLGTQAVIQDCMFLGNHSGAGGDAAFPGQHGGDGGDGGAICDVAGSPSINNCSFQGNWTGDAGSGALGPDGIKGRGGGICTRTGLVSDCSFIDNDGGYGGGIMTLFGSPTVVSCSFEGNAAWYGGGGVCSYGGGFPTVTECTFHLNTAGASYADGGGMYTFENASPTVTNCTFTGNSAPDEGGGMFNRDGSHPTVINCTFTGNSAGNGGGMYNSSCGATVTNCILWGDSPNEIVNSDASPVVTYSDVQGGYAGPGNIEIDPLISDAVGGDLHLTAGSPCIDAADSGAVPPGITTDLDGNPRFVDDANVDDTGIGYPCVDMGAFEVQAALPCTWDCAEPADGEVSVVDFLALLAAWGDTGVPCDVDGGGVGVTDFLELLANWGPCP